MRKILIIEPNEILGKALQGLFDAEIYKVTLVQSGKEALKMSSQGFDMIFGAVQLPDMKGVDFFNSARSPAPFILMGNQKDFKSPQEAESVGAYSFLSPPFNRDQVNEILNRHFGDDSAEADSDSLDLEFVKVHIDDFIHGAQFPYDVYVRLSSSKYVKMARKGDEFAQKMVDSFKQKNVYFYLKIKDFMDYVGMAVGVTNAVKISNVIPKAKKMEFLKNVNSVVMSRLCLFGVDEEAFEHSKIALDAVLSVIVQDEDLMMLLQMLNTHSNALFAHSLGVSLYAIMLARKVGWTSSQAIFKVAMAGLYHDIGKKDLPRVLLDTPRSELSPKQIALLETHTTLGEEILTKVSTIPSEVAYVAVQHHENCLGRGYPKKLKETYIHPMAKLVSVANDFCNLSIRNVNQPNPLKPAVAAEKMLTVLPGIYEQEFLVALNKLFK